MLTSEAVLFAGSSRAHPPGCRHHLQQTPSDHGIRRSGDVTANAEATSNSAKIMKWATLKKDVSVAGGEVGEWA